MDGLTEGRKDGRTRVNLNAPPMMWVHKKSPYDIYDDGVTSSKQMINIIAKFNYLLHSSGCYLACNLFYMNIYTRHQCCCNLRYSYYNHAFQACIRRYQSHNVILPTWTNKSTCRLHGHIAVSYWPCYSVHSCKMNHIQLHMCYPNILSIRRNLVKE